MGIFPQVQIDPVFPILFLGISQGFVWLGASQRGFRSISPGNQLPSMRGTFE